MKRFFTFMLAIVALQVSVMAITLKGRILDKKTKEPLIGASVIIANTSIGAITNFDGFYEITGLQAGTYNIQVSYIGYQPTLMQEIKVSSDAEQILDVKMVAAEVTLDNVMVVAKKNLESENMLLMEQQKAVLAVQSVGAKELSRKGISDAEGAVSKVSGISKQEGVKNVVVRGLGDRYNSTTLNGFAIPSEDPEYKNISLDFFSSDVIKAVGVNKAFTAGGPSDVAGANINILSKELVGESKLQIGISGGANSSSFGEDFLVLDGVNPFGYSTESIPAYSEEVLNFENSLDPEKKTAPMNFGLNIAGGRKFDLTDNSTLSLFAVAAASQKASYTDGVVRKTTNGSLTPFQDQNVKDYRINTNHIGMLNLDYALGQTFNLAYNFMYIHNNMQSVKDFTGSHSETFAGADETGYVGFTRRQQDNDNTLIVNQLIGKYNPTKRVHVEAGVAYNMIDSKEPDRRSNYLSKQPTKYIFTGSDVSQRNYSSLIEDDVNARANVQYDLNDEGTTNVKLGYSGRFTTDEFGARNFIYSKVRLSDAPNPEDSYDLDLDSYYTQANLEAGKFAMDVFDEIYNVEKTVHSVYAEGTYQVNENLIMFAGLKYDQVNFDIDYMVNKAATPSNTSFDKQFFLPNLNMKYNVNEKNSLRFASSITYTLPQSKEISPFRYRDVGFSSEGYADLQPSTNYNFDLKWDYYLGRGELFSVTGFYKMIEDPIARIDVGSAAGVLSYRNVSDKATAAGIEMEFRKTWFSQPVGNEGMQKLSTGLNGSYIYTHCEADLGNEISTESAGDQLEGAAPFIGNLDISYNFRNKETNWTSTLVVNYVSDLVYMIGTKGYNDVMQKNVTTMDFVTQYEFNKHWGVSFKAKNLLDPKFKLEREVTDLNTGKTGDVVLSQYQKGIDLSLGITYKF